jgi:Mn-dependent DtxR family transcriptional regulator
MKDKTFVIKLNDHKVPEFKEERSKDWILYGSKGKYKNRYGDYLLDLFNSSSKHHAIVNGKTDYIVGSGFKVNEEGLNTEQLANLNKFIKSPNSNETLNDLLAKCVLDYEIYNGFALEIIYNQTNEKIAAIHHAEFKQYRKAKEGDFYFYSEDWSKSNPETEVISAFDWSRPHGKQLLYVKDYHPQAHVYPLPGYLGCIPYIEVDREIANYQLNEIKNNFQAGKMINFFNGQPPEEEQGAIERKLKAKFTGTDNANSFILNFNDSREQGAEVINLDGNDFADRYQILEKTTQQNIFSGHRVTSGELFGVKEEGIFSTRNQLRDAYELFQNTYVNNRQDEVLRVFNGLASVQGFEERLYIIDTEPIGVEYSESTKVSVMTEDEIRADIGLPVQEKEDVGEDSKTKDAQAALKGSVGGVSGIITLLQNVSTGVVNTESAIAVLVELYGFSPEVARATVTGEVIPENVAQEMRDTLEAEGDMFSICEAFASCGETIDPKDIIYRRQVDFSSNEQADKSEDILRRFGFGSESFDMAVLEILKENPALRWDAVAEMLESTVDEVMEAVRNLAALDYLKVGTEQVIDTTQKVSEVTSKGSKALETAEPLEVTLKIKYSYIKRAEASGSTVIKTTRDFCRNLVGQSNAGKTWTNEEIQTIGMKNKRNVWLRGGGFWNRGGGVISPHCRHTWEQIIVKNG